MRVRTTSNSMHVSQDLQVEMHQVLFSLSQGHRHRYLLPPRHHDLHSHQGPSGAPVGMDQVLLSLSQAHRHLLPTAPGRARPGPSTPPPPATKRKKRSSSLGTSAAEGRWHSKEEESTKPAPLRFKPFRKPGPTFDTTTAWSPLGLFQLFFSASVVKTVIDNTNANAEKRKNTGSKFEWKRLDIKDFYIFMSIIIVSGLVTVHNWADYWRKEWPDNFHYPANSMTRQRFQAILLSLHKRGRGEREEEEHRRVRPAVQAKAPLHADSGHLQSQLSAVSEPVHQ
ncbi:uncharacterized protein LOC130199937 [Pseudoliparis swirei]|uniref:uncharacterized protein LOC130199937 n=1 Tax=Pseudoliparis swirei TaxID=2059687 RepID=UPI0024BEBD63|nr:uncharacterized protein LOC130199937 [Pseudoliparis swirei]